MNPFQVLPRPIVVCQPNGLAQSNFSELDSHILKAGANLVDYLVSMLECTNVTISPGHCINVNPGYWNEHRSKAREDLGVDPHIAHGRLPHGKAPPTIFASISKKLNAKDQILGSCVRRIKDYVRQAHDERGAGIRPGK